MNILKKLWNALLMAENAIMMTANIGVVILVFISVLMRYILQKNTGGMEELVVFIATWIYFMGGAIGSYENSHITADFLSVFIHNEKAKQIVGMLRHLITLVILLGASYCAIRAVKLFHYKSFLNINFKNPYDGDISSYIYRYFLNDILYSCSFGAGCSAGNGQG